MKKADATRSGRSQSADKVEAILKGAIQEFLSHGYAATTMDKVTAAAGVSKPTVYNYFQDKESLFAAIVEQLTQENSQEFNPQDPRVWQGEPTVVLRNLALNLLQKVKKKPEFRDLVRLIIGESGRFPVLAQIFVRNIDKKLFHHLVEYFKAHQELELPDPEAAARVFFGALVHYIIAEEMLQAGTIMPMESDRLINTLIYLLTLNQTHQSAAQASELKHKASRRKRSASGQFERDYQREPKRLRSVRLTDTAWEKLDAIAQKRQMSRSELIETLARQTEE